MKAGLLTFYHIHHYGAALQAAATQRAVESFGWECEIPDYYVNQNNALFRAPASPSAAAADAHTALHYAAMKRRYDRFEAFLSARLRITARRFASLEELRDGAPPYDLLLSGSDQIWNPLIFPDRRFDPVFFGAFSDARKAAYAPSFGLSRLPDGMEIELGELLAAYSHLSVREPSGQAVLRAAGRDGPVTLDPTLLLTAADWDAMAAAPGKLPPRYVLCYCISDPAPVRLYLRALSESLSLPVVQLCGVRRAVLPSAVLVYDAGPAEFLSLFRNAAAVATNSFHGTAFSVLYEKPFFTAVSPAEQREPEASRTWGLLSRLGLADRVIATGTTADIDALPDWDAVSAALDAARQQSLRYLKAALDDAPYTEETPRKRGFLRRVDLPAGGAPCPVSPAGGAAGKARWTPPILADHGHCTGCSACASVCPKDALKLERGQEGFSYPAVDPSLCVRCGRCTAVCPPLHPRRMDCRSTTATNSHTAVETNASPSAETEPRTSVEPNARPSPGTDSGSPPESGAEAPGSAPAVFAVWHTDPAVRADSSSGGAFSAIAQCVLAEGGVVFGAAMDSRQRVRHTACFQEGDLWRLRGAKYAQSELEDTFREVREALKRRRALFVGTPCQVDGLYHFLGGRPERLVTCDLVCHGVPSPGVWEAMVRYWEEKFASRLESVRFRDKARGWKRSCLTLRFENGMTLSRPLYETGYGHAFGQNLFLRAVCHRCPYAGTRRVGDFTLGDFWGLGPSDLPEEQTAGVSLLLVNTPEGGRLFDHLPLGWKAFPLETALAGNPNLSAPTPCPAGRAAFFASFALEPFERTRRAYLAETPLPVRMAKRALSPERRDALRRLARRSPETGTEDPPKAR